MRSFTVSTIAEGHEKVVNVVRAEGEFRVIKKGDKEIKTLQYPETISVLIQEPLKEPTRHNAYRLSQKYLDQYALQFTTLRQKTGTDKDFEYTYYNRLADFPQPCDDNGNYIWAGDGDGYGIDQIRQIADNLAKNLTSRQIVAHTWHPAIDPYSLDPPCLQLIQFVVWGNRLSMIAYFRSNDMLMAWGSNAYGLAALAKHVISILKEDHNIELTFEDLEMISACPHIYETDLQDADKFLAVTHG